MRILIAPDKFKGSLSASEAAAAIRRGIERAWPDAQITEMPVADGGEGTMQAIHTARGGEWIALTAHDPLGRQIAVRYLCLADDSAAVIDMSEASGARHVKQSERNPLISSTFGTGELILDAIRRGAKRILVGLGGSATNDAGIGMAAALGYRFLTSDGEPLDAIPSSLLALTSIRADRVLPMPEIEAWSDVRNPLLGPTGATRVFGPQKGVDGKTAAFLEAALENLADVAAHDLGCDFRNVPGAGAAGGLGFGLMTFCHAKIQSGFEVVAGYMNLDAAVRDADLVITGEGSLDFQTLHGKAPLGIAKLARQHGKRVIAFAGNISAEVDWSAYFDAVHPLNDGSLSPEESMRDAANLLEQCALRTATLMHL
jgi:glycerate kinase